MTEDQQLMWDILTNDPVRIAQVSAQELAGLAKRRGLVTFYKRVDYWLTYIMNNIHDEIEVVRIVKTWFFNYDLPLHPGRCKSFDRFHKVYGKVIISLSGR
jgi:hypothetical protein